MENETLRVMLDRVTDNYDLLTEEATDLRARNASLRSENLRLTSEVARLGLQVQGLERLLHHEKSASPLSASRVPGCVARGKSMDGDE